jgi:hypothetical protein
LVTKPELHGVILTVQWAGRRKLMKGMKEANIFESG